MSYFYKRQPQNATLRLRPVYFESRGTPSFPFVRYFCNKKRQPSARVPRATTRLLLFENPVAVLDAATLLTLTLAQALPPLLEPRVRGVLLVQLCAVLARRHLLLLLAAAADEEAEEDLARLLAVREVDNDAAAEAGLARGLRNERDLVVGGWVELQHGPGGIAQESV